jgi:hypothetical protein
MEEGGAAHWIADRASGLIVAQPRGRRKLMSADFRVEVSCFYFILKINFPYFLHVWMSNSEKGHIKN